MGHHAKFLVDDTLTYEGAARLARKILDYWHKRGRYPQVRVETQAPPGSSDQKPIFVVRSNMTRGRPA